MSTRDDCLVISPNTPNSWPVSSTACFLPPSVILQWTDKIVELTRANHNELINSADSVYQLWVRVITIFIGCDKYWWNTFIEDDEDYYWLHDQIHRLSFHEWIVTSNSAPVSICRYSCQLLPKILDTEYWGTRLLFQNRMDSKLYQ